MRLLYYTTSYYANHGGSIQAIELFKNLNNQDYVSALDIFPAKKTRRRIRERNSRWNLKKTLKENRLLQILFFYRRNQFYLDPLFKKINQFQPDVILLQIDSNFLQIQYIKKRFPHLKICTQINGSPFDEPFINIAFKNFFLKSQRIAYQLSNLNIFISEYSKKEIMGKFADDYRDVVIHNGTDVEKFFPIKIKTKVKEALKYPSNKFILGYVGTLDYHKKLEMLIKAFCDFSKEKQEAYLVIIGDGPAYKELQLLIQKLKAQDKIILKGWVPHKEINAHINCFDIAVHHHANVYMNPLKVFEYLSAGVPVIAPDIPTIKNYFIDQQDLLITSGTRKDIYDKIEMLFNDKNLRYKLSNKHDLIKRMENNFTWENYSQRILYNIKRTL